jgi:hypothetical protein
MPGEEFVLLKPHFSYLSFTNRMASFPDMLNAMRYVLVQFLHLSIEEACTYTLHSWRHLYPSASRQMLMANDLGCEIGHWVTGSRMPERYDSVASSKELAAKNAIIAEIRQGRKLAAPGEIPVGVPVSAPVREYIEGSLQVLSSVTQPDPEQDVLTNTVMVVPASAPSSVSQEQCQMGIQLVIHDLHCKFHIYAPSICLVKPVCRTWKCGTPEDHKPLVSFLSKDDKRWLESKPFEWCGTCFTNSRIGLLDEDCGFKAKSAALQEPDGESDLSDLATPSSSEPE